MTVHMALIITSRMLKDWVIYCLGGDYFMNCNFCWVLPLSLWDLLHLLPFIKVKVRHVVNSSEPATRRTNPACSWRGCQSQGLLRERLSFVLLCALDLGLGAITPCTGNNTSLQGSQPTCISYLWFREEETRDRRARAACPRSCLGRWRAAFPL